MWPSCHKSSNKEFCSFVSRTDEGVVEEDLFNVEKFHLNRLIDLLPPTSVLGRLQLQQQQQHALTLPRSVIVSTLWDLLRNRLIPQEFDRQLLLLDLNNKLVEKSLTVKASSSSPKQQMEYVLNTLPTPLPPLPPGNMLNDVFLRLHINSYNNNTQLTETNTIASCCFGAVNKALTTHMPYATTAHATKVAQVANYYQGLQMLKQFINTPPPPTTTTNFTASRNSETTKICFYNNSLDQLNCQSFPSRNLHHELSENRLRRKHSDENIVNDASSDSTKCDNTDNLFPPPKKKWIRHYLRANHHQLQFQMHNGNSNNNASSSTNMIVDDVSPPLVQSNQQHSSYSVSLSGQLHSPPRSSVGNHYIQMINSAAVQQATNSNGLSSGTGHVTHVAPRRRTISSNSNGAGTREVHNKLEKNRRAHLKECYEALKNQLSLKDEDRRKPSNLAILGEALKCVQSFQRRNHELEAEWEHLANDKINLQKRIVSLKRELGPKYEQLFSGIFPDIDLNCIPTTSDRGNATTSPINNNNNNINNNNNNVLHNYRKNATTAAAAMQAITIPTNTTHISPMGSPTALITFGSGGNTGNMPLSLTAKNISATSVTRGSPTPSTPSPSPSSSSGVSSSSSLISSSPPINGVISNCRNVTVNIPNGLKFQATVGALGTTITGTSSGTATTTAASMVVPATNNTNNAVATAPSPNTTPIGHNGRKKSLSLSCSNGLMENSGVGHAIQKQLLTEDGEQPAKFLKVFNNSCSSASQDELNNGKKTKTSIVGGQMQKLVLSGTTGGGGGVGNGSVNELCRLPGGAELNILPRNGIKTSSVATAFYHANGKLTFVNAPPNNNNNNNNSNVTVNSSHHISNITNANGIHFSGNFSQLLTAANSTATTGLCQTGNNTIVAVSASPTTPITTSPSALITQNGNITAVAAASPLNNINGKSAISWHTPTI
uniref:BHLH domain-containing protein n=1 Tax=Glossina brevipalpis TaxID=37001 RepID=A0A1A9WL70_9MUSC